MQVGDDVPPMRKARLSSMRGQAAAVLSPYHTELLNVATAAEVPPPPPPPSTRQLGPA